MQRSFSVNLCFFKKIDGKLIKNCKLEIKNLNFFSHK